MCESEDDLTPADRELETALRSVAPTGATIDPVAAAFSAGQTAARTDGRRWRSAAMILLVVSAASWLRPALQDRGDGGPREASIEMKSTTLVVADRSVTPPFAPQTILMLQQAVNDRGLSALPASELPTVRATRAADAL